MEKNETINRTDVELLSFLHSINEKAVEVGLAELLSKKIQPVVEKTLRSKLHVSLKPSDYSQTNQDALEIASEIKLLLVSELGKLKSNPNGKIIHNLNSYVVSVTINAYRQYLRAKYPLRRQLKNKLRYLLTHHRKFALWEDQTGWFCGFEEYKSTGKFRFLNAEAIRAGISETVNKNNLRENSRIVDLLATVFDFAKVPVSFNDLLSLVAKIQEIKDQKEVSETDYLQSEILAVSDNQIRTEIEQKEYLEKIWIEICELPIRHRLALLLNLKDKQGDCVIRLFPVLRIASVRQIAEALEFPAEEFASVWRELPWEDFKIAEFMNLTRQQVINLRQSARARIVREFRQIE